MQHRDRYHVGEIDIGIWVWRAHEELQGSSESLVSIRYSQERERARRDMGSAWEVTKTEISGEKNENHKSIERQGPSDSANTRCEPLTNPRDFPTELDGGRIQCYVNHPQNGIIERDLESGIPRGTFDDWGVHRFGRNGCGGAALRDDASPARVFGDVVKDLGRRVRFNEGVYPWRRDQQAWGKKFGRQHSGMDDWNEEHRGELNEDYQSGLNEEHHDGLDTKHHDGLNDWGEGPHGGLDSQDDGRHGGLDSWDKERRGRSGQR
ncbi:hypothetical protein BJ322DRAFT_1220635 [Thelephora terrestris]|uniref:Uncharacterized protein n=1 Tax=Thelephora terrestris TaxID=56493 RepID=A0A9P6H7W4_9AGAM|nr:hypothetical protein BJ322DRAFT_1220635 [Thelephora terrestris]